MAPASAIPPPLPPTVEEAYRRKCNKLRQRTNEVEKANDASRVRLNRLKRQIEKLRLERAFLYEQLAKRTSTNVEDSDGSPSPPPTVSPHHPSSLSPRWNGITLSNLSQNERDHRLTPSRSNKQPKEKPLRLKRGHRKASMLPIGGGGDGSGSQAGGSQAGGNGAGSSSLAASQFISQNPGASHSPSSDAFSMGLAGRGLNGVHREPPKKPGNAFELYCNERNTAAAATANNTTADATDIDKTEEDESRREVDDEELAQGWKDLSETQRGEFETRAGENMAQYEKERGEYDAATAAAEAEAAKRQKESEEAEEKSKENGTGNATEEEEARQKDEQGDVEMGEYDSDQETQMDKPEEE
ncbi:hypothetical protein B0T21DRAFT_394265 [Apiosordaria backusii]|uniref:HMG box domain-containing protein n=1 Tax=Apiosordaria backusii TaxID=314023 RepID=A0AA40BEM3_9PEZI|nr:hypothetical protein B0T21DRAFT_394265 [Apiosordaria backusii]